MKIKSKTKDYQLIVKVKTSKQESINEKELDIFSRAFIRGFLKPKLVKKNLIEYSGPIGISLEERLKKPVNKRDFLFILEQLVVAIQKLKTRNLSINNLIMFPQNIFINEVTREIQLIYLPLESGFDNSNISELIEAVVYSAKPVDEKDDEFVSRFIYYFKAMEPFSIDKVERYILKEDRDVVNTVRRKNAGSSGMMQEKHYQVDNVAEDDDMATGLLDENDGYVPDEYEDTAPIYSNFDDTAEISALGDDYEDTMQLTEDDTAAVLSKKPINNNIHYPTLKRLLNDEIVSINKPVFRLGKERSYVDYFVTNNAAVSRSHADIITRGHRYFIKDLGSKNHTYINRQEISVNFETEICDGDSLILGNEEFVFNT